MDGRAALTVELWFGLKAPEQDPRAEKGCTFTTAASASTAAAASTASTAASAASTAAASAASTAAAAGISLRILGHSGFRQGV